MKARKVRSATIERRQEILQGALDVFFKKGIFETKIADIKQHCGASIGSIYHLFESKQHIVFEIYHQHSKQIHDHLLEVLQQDPEPRYGIAEIVRRYIQWYADHPVAGWFMFRAADAGFLEEQSQQLREMEQSFLRHFREWMSKTTNCHLVDQVSPAIMVPIMIGPSREFLRRWLPKGSPQLLEQALEYLPHAAWQTLKSGALDLRPKAHQHKP